MRDDEAPAFDPEQFKNWKPAAQRKALDLLERSSSKEWKPFYCPNPKCDGEPHGDWSFRHARDDQRPPPWNGDWLTWAILSGRGAGKTRSGSELTNRITQRVSRIGVLGPTGPDVRETIVEGESGIQACAQPGKEPIWMPSRKRLEWPNGCIAELFSGEEPDRIRGKNIGFWWVDEGAHMPLIEEAWRQLKLTLRSPGDRPHILLTTTPKPTRWMKSIAADAKTIVTRVSTYKNLANLNEVFRQTIMDEFEGTRFGKQELEGEILLDVDGSLWKHEMLVNVKQEHLPELARIVVAVDPAGSANRRSDETGIIVVGITRNGYFYVLADYSDRYSPSGWADMARQAFDEFSADAIVAEKNYGGDMVRHTLESTGTDARVVLVDSRRGKELRAEPVVGLYEKGKVLHVQGPHRADLLRLEEEMTTWIPGKGASPNRVDALVHGVTHLRSKAGPAAIGSPNGVLSRMGIQSPISKYLGGGR